MENENGRLIEEDAGKGESEMSLIFNMFKYANPLKRARAKLGTKKGQKQKAEAKKKEKHTHTRARRTQLMWVCVCVHVCVSDIYMLI